MTAAEVKAMRTGLAHRTTLGLCLLITATSAAEPFSTNRFATSMTETTLTEAEQRRSRHWQLTDTEWRRYRMLMEGIRGSVSVATISPVEVLGIHARDDAERWARLMHEDAGRVLAFQHAYSEVFRQIYPGEPLIDPGKLPGAAPAIGFQHGDRLLFFTRSDCVPCNAWIPKLLHAIQTHRGVGLDIYLTDSDEGEDEAVRAWAHAQAIPPEMVRSRTITLNHDNGMLRRLTDTTTVPHLLHRRADRLLAVTPESLGRSR